MNSRSTILCPLGRTFSIRSLIFICLIWSTSCNFRKRHFAEMLKAVDKVEIQDFVDNDTTSHWVTNQAGIDVFTNIINGRQEHIPTGQKTGRILYYSKGKLILEASQFAEGIEYSSDHTLYKERITYQAGMYFAFGPDKTDQKIAAFKDMTVVFNQNEPFQIISSARSVTDQSSAKDTSDCKGWTISKDVLPKIIKDSRNVFGTEWDLTFLVLPCIIKGQLEQQGKLFDFEVNAGSWIYIKSADTTLILGNYRKEDEKYFVEKPNKE